ncbi:MAG: MmgE/PrpD family protein [Microbacteriaceae bacterium]|nr:MAG: MmgE/PrpD family protein [Microbacteriaceae bacterium]
MATIVEQLARFTRHDSEYSRLPSDVVAESKRVLIDSLGCALAAVDVKKGHQGIAHGLRLGAGNPQATIIGTGHKVSIFGAAWANAELINALDFDAVLAPGHVAPYVLPAALAVAEDRRASGRELLSAIAASHEMSFRFGTAMSLNRDVANGRVSTADVLGYSSTIFGATAAVTRLQQLDDAVTANAIAIAGSITTVNSHRAWLGHAPSATIKYLLSGWLAQSALTAASMAELGHRGDLQILDDPQYGYPKFIGTTRWEPGALTDGLGVDWRFPAEQSYKPYPQVRITHALVDAIIEIVEANDIRPEEIERIHAWGEGWVMLPTFLNRDIQDVHDAQFSMPHGLAVAAHRLVPGREWQDPDLVFSPSVSRLMDRVTIEPHPDFAVAISGHPAARPSRVEITARGETFVAERAFVKGSPSPDPSTYFTDEQLVEKFTHNAKGVITDQAAEAVVEMIGRLEQIDDVTIVIQLLTPR